jgi:hypothetical protein
MDLPVRRRRARARRPHATYSLRHTGRMRVPRACMGVVSIAADEIWQEERVLPQDARLFCLGEVVRTPDRRLTLVAPMDPDIPYIVSMSRRDDVARDIELDFKRYLVCVVFGWGLSCGADCCCLPV